MIEIIPYIILAIEDDGDREFMAWLYIQYQSLLYSEIIRIVQSSTDAEDVLHTVIEKLIDIVGFLRKLDRRGLVNYIITAAKNTAYNYCRDKKKELDFDFEQEVIVDNYDSLEDDIIKRENLFCLDQVWNSLDSKTQYLLSAKYLYRTLLLSAPKNILTTVDKSGIKSYPFVCIVWTGVSKYKERNSANL